MANANQHNASLKLSERLVDFIQKKRIVLLLVLAIVIIGISGISGVYAFLESTEKKAASYVEEMVVKYEEIRSSSDESKKDGDTAAFLNQLKESSLLGRMTFSSARLSSLLAGIYADKKDWPEAEKYWLMAADKAPKSFMAPVAVYNAATAAEERGDGVKAIELYQRCIDVYDDDFPMAPRALFAIGRINEERKDFAAADAAYKKMADRWPDDGWTKLAGSRIIHLAGSGSK